MLSVKNSGRGMDTTNGSANQRVGEGDLRGSRGVGFLTLKLYSSRQPRRKKKLTVRKEIEPEGAAELGSFWPHKTLAGISISVGGGPGERASGSLKNQPKLSYQRTAEGFEQETSRKGRRIKES